MDKSGSNAGVRLTDEQAAPPTSHLKDLALLIASDLEDAALVDPGLQGIYAYECILKTLRGWKW